VDARCARQVRQSIGSAERNRARFCSVYIDVSRHKALIPTLLCRVSWWLIAATTLASITSACGQLAGSADQSAAGRPTGSAAVKPSVPVLKAPSAGAAVKHADLISSLSCAGHACTAVGDYYYGTSSSSTLVERWTGVSWQLERSPDSARYSSLSGVSCPNGASCVAVGAPSLTGHGRSWQVSARFSPFTAVSCVTTRFCLAVGVTGNGAPVYGTWHGRAWHTTRLPAPRLSQASEVNIAGVSCATPEFCLAVGDYFTGVTALPNPASRDRTLSEEWDGRYWRALHPANVSRRDAFSAVSCASPAICTAVGTSASQYPLAEHWDGTSWRIEHMPLPGRLGYTELAAVSCASASACVAVGNYQGRPLAMVSRGGSWGLGWLPHPAGDDNPLQSVSCASAVVCMAVGADVNASASYAERWNGARWQLLRMRNPR
jgi:hypothetical protein